MTKKRIKKIVDERFYHQDKVLDRLNYIERVLDSCNTFSQLEIAYTWAKDVLYDTHRMFAREVLDKYMLFNAMPLSRAYFRKIEEAKDHLRLKYDEAYNKVLDL